MAWSTSSTLNIALQDSLRPCTLVYEERDDERDGRVDAIDMKLSIPIDAAAGVFELERPFDAPPDAGALVAVDVFKGRNIHWRNSVVDAGAFQFFGGGVDLVAAENVGERFGGFISWAQWHAPSNFIGPTFVATPNLAVQWLDNDVVEGNGVVNYWTTSDAVTGATEPAWPLGRWTLNGAALGASP